MSHNMGVVEKRQNCCLQVYYITWNTRDQTRDFGVTVYTITCADKVSNNHAKNACRKGKDTEFKEGPGNSQSD